MYPFFRFLLIEIKRGKTIIVFSLVYFFIFFFYSHKIDPNFIPGTSVRCFWLLDYVEANVELSNSLCFVQIRQAIKKIFQKNPAQGRFLISSIFDLWRQGPKSYLSFLVRWILFISPCRVKLEPRVRAKMIEKDLRYNND